MFICSQEYDSGCLSKRVQAEFVIYILKIRIRISVTIQAWIHYFGELVFSCFVLASRGDVKIGWQ